MSSHLQKRLEKARRKLLKAEYKQATASPPRSTGELTAILRELYDTDFPDPRDYATYHMLCRYKEKLSPKGYSKWQSLRGKGRVSAINLWKALVYRDNPFLAVLTKQRSFKGKYIPCPIYPKK